MGSPRQEEFIDANWEQLGVNIAIGVGGSFEVLANRLVRAPRWLQRLGLEWAFRMLQEPRRLTRRYADTLFWLVRRTAPLTSGLVDRSGRAPAGTSTPPSVPPSVKK